MAALAVAIIAGGTPSAAQPPPAPPQATVFEARDFSTPAGRRFAELIALVNAGDGEALTRFAHEAFSPSMLRVTANDSGILGFLSEQHAMFGGFDVIRVLDSDPEQIGVLVRPRRDPSRRLRYVVGAEPEPPHRVTGLFLFLAPPDATGSEGDALDVDSAVAELGRAVERAAAAGRFSGSFLLARHGAPLLRHAYGEANREHHAPNRPETLFSLASVSKMFTAVAVARLVEDGRIGWDDPVSKHLDGWLPPDLAGRITVRHLLTHTSGLGDYLGEVADGSRVLLLPDVEAYRPLCAEAGASGEPGEFRYSNLGYVVLGAIIEAASGRDYYDFVRDEVFRPAGMARSAWYSADEVVEGRATGYCRGTEIGREDEGDDWYTNDFLHGVRGTPAGGSHSNVDDLLAFANALRSHTLIGAATTDSLLAPRVVAPMGGEYAFGFLVGRGRTGGRSFGHAGGFPGVSTSFRVWPESGWTLIALSNLSAGADEVVETWRGLMARIHEH
jgi:CubicO group peptidase (beta-lactamase class C family)